MLEEVAAETGLDDFGDPSFREGLEQVWASGTTQAGLTRARARRARRPVSGQPRQPPARHRLAPPSSRGRERSRVEQPIFIVGLSRTGTTALSHLLACDPANRSLLGWEAGQSVPPPEQETLRRRPAVRRRARGRRHARPAQPGVQGDPPRPTRPAVGVRGAARAALPLREPVDVLQRSRLRRVDARGRRPSLRTRTTGRCCRCSSRRIPDSGSSSRRCTASSSTRSPTRIPTPASW